MNIRRFVRVELKGNAMFKLHKIKRLALSAAMAGAAFAAAPAQAALVNAIPTNWTSIHVNGFTGVLRAGSPWGPGSSPADLQFPIDGVFRPEGTQWNNGSYWWDQDPSINQDEVIITINLNQVFTFEKFILQADDNDGYLMEYWDGGSWQLGWDFGTQPSFGLVTRPDALVNITTNRFRLRAYGGDQYYGISEFQGFVNTGVPEPAAWALMLGGFGLVGASMRRRRSLATVTARACGAGGGPDWFPAANFMKMREIFWAPWNIAPSEAFCAATWRALKPRRETTRYWPSSTSKNAGGKPLAGYCDGALAQVTMT